MRAAIVLALIGAVFLAVVNAPPALATKSCVGADEASARAAGDPGENDDEEEEAEDEGAPPKFSAAFYRRVFTLDASLDGIDGKDLPISIEEVCDVPKRLAKQAAQLAGADGVALLRAATTVWQGRTRLSGSAATRAVEGADTAVLRVRLIRPRAWREDEDGEPIATFRTGRIDVTD